jgi:hypothetical protein
VEARRGARRVTQHQLGEPAADPDASPPVPEGGSETTETPPPPEEGPTPPPTPLEPSDLALRERQRAWWHERARFEAAQRRRAEADEASK